jgi:Ion transport protein N-terminal
MSTGAIVGIIVAVIIVAAVVVLGPALLRQVRMRRQFGPEYNRLAKELGSRKAVAELAARQRRVDALGIHPLSAEQQARYNGEWTTVQERFVDAPAAAVSAADTLIWDVMRDRGYPADNKDASLEALSVYHARPLDDYRQAQEIKTESASTEELRTTLIRYRALFQDLVGVPVGQRVFARGAATATRPAAGTDGYTRRIAIVPSKTAGTPR